ncbi:MAG: hypothetical protein MdMp014T_2316 [Treponematales bacterium]
MASCMYSKKLPDYGDLDNVTGSAPGYKVYVSENDGGVLLQMFHAERDNPMTSMGYSVFMNVAEAKGLLRGLQMAINRAEPKHANHKNRGEDC